MVAVRIPAPTVPSAWRGVAQCAASSSRTPPRPGFRRANRLPLGMRVGTTPRPVARASSAGAPTYPLESGGGGGSGVGGQGGGGDSILKWLLDDDDDDGEEEKHGALAGLVHKIRESLEGVFEAMILFFNLIGTGVIVFKSMYAIIPTMKWLRMMDQGEKGFPLVHHSLARIRLGRGILLGLDFYLVSDIIETFTQGGRVKNLIVLAVLIGVRTFVDRATEKNVEHAVHLIDEVKHRKDNDAHTVHS